MTEVFEATACTGPFNLTSLPQTGRCHSYELPISDPSPSFKMPIMGKPAKSGLRGLTRVASRLTGGLAGRLAGEGSSNLGALESDHGALESEQLFTEDRRTKLRVRDIVFNLQTVDNKKGQTPVSEVSAQ